MAQADSKTKTIGGVEYQIMMLDPFTAGDMANDLGRICAPLLGGALGVKDLASLMKKEADPAQIAAIQKGLADFFKEFTKAQQRELMLELSKVTFVKEANAMVPLNEIFLLHFTGHIGRMYQWLFFAVQVQFADLFEGLGAAISSVVPTPQSE